MLLVLAAGATDQAAPVGRAEDEDQRRRAALTDRIAYAETLGA